jgi:hypothetical protein
MDRLESRWVKLLGGSAWIEATTKKDTQWLAALRCLDRSGNARLLVKLLRSKIAMPSGLEMSPTARQLVADLLERWRVRKRDKRLITLFKPDAKDHFDEAKRAVQRMPSGVVTLVNERQLERLPREVQRRLDRDELKPGELIRAFRALQKTMSREDRIDAVAHHYRIDRDSLRQHLTGKFGFGRGKKRRPSSKSPATK